MSLARALALLGAALALGGCRDDRLVLDSTMPGTYQDRHPILVTEGLATLDLLPGGGPGGLTDRQAGDVRAFGAGWQARGRGPISIQVPLGGTGDAGARYSLREIRANLAAAGVPAKAIGELRYTSGGPLHLAPVRLVYPVVQARVPHRCGHWPDDINRGGKPGGTNENRDYWNYGCAYQQNMAAMVADPEDFLRPRGEEPPDANRRSTVVDKYRKGESTATRYPDPEAEISEIGTR